MISKEEYIKSLKVVEKYKQQVNSKLVSDKYCSICEKSKVEIVEPIYLNPLLQETGMWNGGTVSKISFGYGSNYDEETYYITVCDGCIEKLEEKGLVINLKNIKHVL